MRSIYNHPTQATISVLNISTGICKSNRLPSLWKIYHICQTHNGATIQVHQCPKAANSNKQPASKQV